MRVIGTVGLGNCANDLVALTGKRLGRLPRWARKIPKLAGPWNNDNPQPFWVDHPGSSGEVLILEPYQFSSADAEELLGFAKAHNLDFSISAISQHYPTRTLCIHLWPKGSTTQGCR
jgi:hypothetical protein